MKNAFEALCQLAVDERWCWKMVCTTCGHDEFRRGLQAIAMGDHPESKEWGVHRGGSRRGKPSFPDRYGPELPRGGWPADVQAKLQDVVAGASVARLRECCPHSDWLGYLGLALFYSEQAESREPKITREVASQLLEIVDHGRRADKRLLILEQAIPGQQLRWQDLEAYEYRV